MKRVLITGSRTWDDYDLILRAFTQYQEGRPGEEITLVHGTARGADRLGERAAKALGWQIEAHPANWNLYGKSAGYKRNEEMVNSGVDICLAFIENYSKGATMCARIAENAGIRTVRFEKGDKS